jgi:hypothetical protein
MIYDKKKKRPIISLSQRNDGVWVWREGYSGPEKPVTQEDVKKHPWFEKWMKNNEAS